jgi:hypothetical protein
MKQTKQEQNIFERTKPFYNLSFWTLSTVSSLRCHTDMFLTILIFESFFFV